MLPQFSVSWDDYKNSITSRLINLQQNGEFVDMTLAADGHLVKVHQMVLALASPYLKELITSAPCPHPVIFLNKISYGTLTALLEYMYTGEAMIEKDSLNELLEAARELRITGFEDTKLQMTDITQKMQEGRPLTRRSQNAKDIFITTTTRGDDSFIRQSRDPSMTTNDDSRKRISISTRTTIDPALSPGNTDHDVAMDSDFDAGEPEKKEGLELKAQVQFTLSNMGCLQMILNRYVFGLQYTSRKENSGMRSWRCTEKQKKCRAIAVTKHNVVVKRYGVHNHPRHDKKILKKVRENAVFATLNDVESMLQAQKAITGKPAVSDDIKVPAETTDTE